MRIAPPKLLECALLFEEAQPPPKQAARSLYCHPFGLSIMDAIFASAVASQPFLGLPGFTELWPILAIVFLLFGARKLPELARSMGSSVTQFRKGLKDAEEEVEDSTRIEMDSDQGDSSSKE